MTDRELMQRALDALDGYARNCRCEGGGAPCDAAEALRARLAEPEPEVRWDASAPLVVHLHPAFQATPPQQPEQEPINYEEWNYNPMTGKPLWDKQPEPEPVAWMHNFIDEVVIAHRPADLDRHPDRWTALYKDPTPCQTCEALARTVMMDQTYHDSVMAQHRKPPTQDLSAPLTVNGVPMYPQREWQTLTENEIKHLWYEACQTNLELTSQLIVHLARNIEAKLKEKNT